MLQQYLPFTVLKRLKVLQHATNGTPVATVLTVYGIETILTSCSVLLFMVVATVLTVYGIETYHIIFFGELVLIVATVLTVYGIETSDSSIHLLPIVNVATVLTVYGIETFSWCQTIFNSFQLQQYLPFTVLKRFSRINKKIYI